MKNKLPIAAALTIIAILFFQPVNAGGWRLIINKNGIKEYERDVAGGLREFMAVSVINAKMEVIGEIIRDVPSMPQWVATCLKARVVKKMDRNNMIIYTIMDSPWPTADRDVIVKNKTVFDLKNARTIITFEAVKQNLVPLTDTMVRIKTLKGHYTMDFLGRDKTKIIYRQLVDPSGKLPKKAAYMILKNYPYESLMKLKSKMITQSKYASRARGTKEENLIVNNQKKSAYVIRIFTERLLKYVENKKALQKIISNDSSIYKNIMKSGGKYSAVHIETKKVFTKYLETLYYADSKIKDKMRTDKSMEREIMNLIFYDCGLTRTKVDTIAMRYKKKYTR